MVSGVEALAHLSGREVLVQALVLEVWCIGDRGMILGILNIHFFLIY